MSADISIRRHSRSKFELAQETLREAVLAAVERRSKHRGDDDTEAIEFDLLFESERPLLEVLPDD